MTENKAISTAHDFIHDVAYDAYGKRMATCSADQKVKVWEQDAKGEWKNVETWRTQSGNVLRLAWAHPEFGQVLAACSSDRSVHIYEEQVNSKTGQRVWKQQARLVDSRDSVTCLQFAPRHHGLKLATSSADGHVRIYEAADPLNLSAWTLQEEFNTSRRGGLCLSWNLSQFDAPTMAVGFQEGPSRCQIWEFMARANKWQSIAELEGHDAAVHDVAWAPNMGRSYHLIATACKDKFARVYRVSLQQAERPLKATLVAKLDHQAEVWRVSWNVTGTLLATTAEDGIVRLFKQDLSGSWERVASSASQPQTEGPAST